MKSLVLYVILVSLFFVLWGCSDKVSTSNTDQFLTVIKRDTIKDTLSLIDSLIFSKYLTSDTINVFNKYSRFIVSGRMFIDSLDDSTIVVEKERVDTLVKKTLQITAINANQTTYDTVLVVDTIIGVHVKVIRQTLYRDTVAIIKALLDTQYTMFVVATTSDYQTGNMGMCASAGSFQSQKHILPIHSDSRVQCYDSSVFIIERFGKDNIIRIKGPIVSPNTIIYQQNLGTGINIHDIAFVSKTKAYVTQYGSTHLLIINPLTGLKSGSIDLSRFCTYAGTDSVQPYPFMECSKVYGSKVYILCQRLKIVQSSTGPTYKPSEQPGIIAVISSITDSVIDSIGLTLKNPTAMDTTSGLLLVSSTGSWTNSSDGGIEKINLSTDSSHGVLISESSFGGNIGLLTLVNSQKGYVCVSKYSDNMTKFWTELVEFNPSTGTVGTKVAGIEDAFGGLLYDGYYIIVGERNRLNSGIVFINPQENKLVNPPIPTGLPPSSIAVLDVNML